MLFTANVVPSLLILFTVMMEATRSSETFVLTRAIRHHIPEDDILITVHCSHSQTVIRGTTEL
jgi:hypothetical protein